MSKKLATLVLKAKIRLLNLKPVVPRIGVNNLLLV